MAQYDCIAVYITTNDRNGAIYTGSTSDLESRIHQHKLGVFDGFSKEKGCTRLVWFEVHAEMGEAIRRERAIKHWPRAWKLALIEALNPEWRDLSDGWYGDD